MTIETKALRALTTATRQDASAEGKASESFKHACIVLAQTLKAADVSERKGATYHAIREAAIKGWTSGKYPMAETGAVQRCNRAVRNALRINGDAEAWQSKQFPDAHFESAGGRGLDKDWQPCKVAAVNAKGSKAAKPSSVSGGATGSPEPANETGTAGNVSEGHIAPSELHRGAIADLTRILELAEDSPMGNQIAALANSAIVKLEAATGRQLTD